jgi:hypothetical protein
MRIYDVIRGMFLVGPMIFYNAVRNFLDKNLDFEMKWISMKNLMKKNSKQKGFSNLF